MNVRTVLCAATAATAIAGCSSAPRATQSSLAGGTTTAGSDASLAKELLTTSDLPSGYTETNPIAPA